MIDVPVVVLILGLLAASAMFTVAGIREALTDETIDVDQRIEEALGVPRDVRDVVAAENAAITAAARSRLEAQAHAAEIAAKDAEIASWRARCRTLAYERDEARLEAAEIRLEVRRPLPRRKP